MRTAIQLGLLALLYAAGLVLASNLKTCASFIGNYLIGRHRFNFIPAEHRREREMRSWGVAMCVVAMLFALTPLFTGPPPGWANVLALIVGAAPPIFVWNTTSGTHGEEIADDAPAKSPWEK